jgi:hypothetical protein
MIFQYVRYSLEPTSTVPSGEIGRPRIPIRIIGRKRSLQVFGLLDTGADHVFLSAALAETLGIDLGDQAETVIAAGGHQSDVWPGIVEIEISQGDNVHRWRANVGFIAGDDARPLPISATPASSNTSPPPSTATSKRSN